MPLPRPRTFRSAALAIVSALGFQLLRELAIGQLMHTAERLWRERSDLFGDRERGHEDDREHDLERDPARDLGSRTEP